MGFVWDLTVHLICSSRGFIQEKIYYWNSLNISCLSSLGLVAPVVHNFNFRVKHLVMRCQGVYSLKTSSDVMFCHVCIQVRGSFPTINLNGCPCRVTQIQSTTHPLITTSCTKRHWDSMKSFSVSWGCFGTLLWHFCGLWYKWPPKVISWQPMPNTKSNS